jgi:superfamily II DNA/RNA helicase
MASSRPRTNAPMSSSDPDGFAELGVPAALVAALSEAGVTTPFPIQADTLPDSLSGRCLYTHLTLPTKLEV